MIDTLIQWFIKAVVLIFAATALWWVLTHPETAAHAVTAVIDGIARLARSLIKGISNVFAH